MENNEEQYPTAKILMRFSSKQNINVSDMKHKQAQVRHDISQQARTLTNATNNEARRAKQLDKARQARKKVEE